MTKQMNTPKLRFPEFSDKSWKQIRMGDVFSFKVTNSFSREKLNYEVGEVKNIHYGDIHTKFQTLFDITKEVVPFINSDIPLQKISSEYYCKEGDLIFADASEDLNDVGKSIEVKKLNNEKVLAGLHTLLARPLRGIFPIGFCGYLFKTEKIRVQIQKESQGSKVLSINVGRLSNIIINYPLSIVNCEKIANFLTAVDEKLQALNEKKGLLEQYKKGIMQQIFSQTLRFKNDDGTDFPEWDFEQLNKYLFEPKKRNFDLNYSRAEVLSVSGEFGVVNQIELLGRSFAGESIANYHVVELGSIVYTKSPLKANPFGIIKVNKTLPGIVSTLYAVYSCNVNMHGAYLDYYFQLDDNLNKYLRPLVRKGAKNDMKINNAHVLSGYISIPSIFEQQKIATFLSAIDEKLEKVSEQITDTESYKKGLLQQMFV